MRYLLALVAFFLLTEVAWPSSLDEVARRERARRSGTARTAPVFTNADLAARHVSRATETSTPLSPALRPPRDLERERVYWAREKEKIERDLARVDTERRRLEERLAAHRSKESSRRRRHFVAGEDLAERGFQERLAALVRERAALLERFLERGRKAGAFPGWLR